MEPDRQEIDHVVARVVAWHNRHPLALTITAAHVHSVGVVNLPFAVQGARVERVEPAPPTEPVPPVAPPPPAAEPEPAADGGEPVVELVTELDAPAAAAPEQEASAPPVAHDAAMPAPSAPGGAPEIVADEPRAPMAQTIVHLPKRPAQRGWLQRWAAWRARGAYQRLFTEDFAPPLRPRRIARWAATHGVAELPLGPAAQQRLVTLDAGLRRADQGPEVQIYLLTAAIGIGEQRKRVLLAPDPQGPVIGPRHWNRPRQAALAAGASGLTAVLASTVIGLWPSAPTAAAASAAGSPAPAASTAMASAAAAASSPSEPARAASAPASQPVAQQVAAASAPPSTQPHPRPPDVEPRLGRIELPSIKPRLSDGERQAAREPAGGTKDKQADLAVPRSSIAPPPSLAPAKAYALVSRPMADPRKTQRVVEQLQAVALLQPKPMRTELMKTAKGWQAVSWPFASAGDAEKVRLALADKGLRTEVIEF